MKEIEIARIEYGFIFPENPVKRIPDFSKCGLKVGTPNFRIFSEAGFKWVVIIQKRVP